MLVYDQVVLGRITASDQPVDSSRGRSLRATQPRATGAPPPRSHDSSKFGDITTILRLGNAALGQMAQRALLRPRGIQVLDVLVVLVADVLH